MQQAPNKLPQVTAGYLLIDKPTDWTSHDVVAYIRKLVREYFKKNPSTTKTKNIRVGHAGTLDPFATGLLIVGVGREATKHIDQFKTLKKTYLTTIHLGATSDTYDRTGNIRKSEQLLSENTEQCNNKTIQQYNRPPIPTTEKIKTTLTSFLGPQLQIPPMFSAKKVQGQKLYDLARKGIEIARKPASVHIYSIDLHTYDFPSLTIEVTCSTGTYIRSLVHDIGQTLGTGAYCEALRRTAIGPYDVKQAITPTTLSSSDWHRRLFF